jgi:hypothetical protein
MTLYKEREEAIKLRLHGLSYNVIREKVPVSKSTLSCWLREFPLSRECINELRAKSPIRIEKFRNTMQKKREERLKKVYTRVANDIKKMSKREIFLAGLFLYWGEGGKTKEYSITLSNTDPQMIIFYLKWLRNIGVSQEKIRVRLHVYSDMDIDKETRFWEAITGLNKNHFQKPHIKKSDSKKLTYRRGYGHGTCNIIVDERTISEYVLQGLKYIKNSFDKR